MIDRQTVDRIMDAADIVEVVSEFVSLRKSGASYKGLCPFHNERTPSFYVSPSRGICKCFSCGKGGNAVGFIMEHEQMTYPEALRWLARKYGIEIKERELSDEEKKQESDRESMFIVNEWAAGYFEDLLHNSPDGMAIGMQYFRSRGFRDDTIRTFRLGFSSAVREALPQAAIKKGYKEEFLVKTGICYKRESDGRVTDRFAGRVIFPWIGMSGKVVAFGGRKLDKATKGVQQKYVNSPDSDIYHKEQQLYGIFQAKKAMAKENCVYMVEGYTDVISMHQCGIENVVANSGTALSLHQIRILRRFTPNVVLLYDGDEAGIHAAMRGTDMMLAEGMNIKVLLLPDGDDPDSFARKHTAKDFREYVAQNQKDFIDFKIDLMIRGVRDPIKRAEAVNSIIKSISVIKDQIVRATYINLCVNRLGINEPTIISTLNKFIRSNIESVGKRAQAVTPNTTARPAEQTTATASPQSQTDNVERMIAQLTVKHGGEILYRNVQTEDGGMIDMRVAQYIGYDLGQDDIRLKNPLYARILEEAVEHCGEPEFNSEQYFTRHSDVEVSNAATQMVMDVPLAKSLRIRKDEESLVNETNHLLLDMRKIYIEERLAQLKVEISKAAGDNDRLRTLITGQRYYPEPRTNISNDCIAQLVTGSPVSPDPTIVQGFVRTIIEARDYLYMETPYFLPTETIMFALHTAVSAGVDVRLIVPMRSDAKVVEWASRSYVLQAIDAGVKVYAYAEKFNHSKFLVADDTLCTCGSTNIDFRSFENNFEANIFFYDRDVAKRMKQVFLDDMALCISTSELKYTHRPSYIQRLWESSVRLLSPLL